MLTDVSEKVRSDVPQTMEDREVVLQVRDLRKHFVRRDGVTVPAIDDVSFDLHAGEFMVLLGPSGCGKTTLLRSVAGLERPQEGEVRVGGQMVFAADKKLFLRPEERNLSVVFQSYALWPHMTVFQNIAYPLRFGRGQKHPKREIATKVGQMLATMRLEGLGGQYPNQLSGGQQQRVALSRALVGGSGVVLFDEPLSNVDAKVRESLRIELLLMQRELGFAALLVTHDQQEAMALAHTVAVLDRGKMVQKAAPDVVYSAPSTPGTAAFVGAANELPGTVAGIDGQYVTVQTSHGPMRGVQPFTVVSTNGARMQVGDAVVAMWRPEAFRSTHARDGTGWLGTIQQSWYYGSLTESLVRVDGTEFRVQFAFDSLPASGEQVRLDVDPDRVFVYARPSESS